MALTVQGSQSSSTTSVTIPTHAVGDLIVICAYTRGISAIGKPSASGSVPAWVDIDNPAITNSNGIRTAQFVATSSSHTSGTWSNADRMIAVVLRGQAFSPIGGHGTQSSSTGGSATVSPSITMAKTNGTSAVLYFHGFDTCDGFSGTPSGTTQLIATSGSGTAALCCNTLDNTGVSTAPSESQTVTNPNGLNDNTFGNTIEIKAAPLGEVEIGGSNAAATTSVTLPTHAVGDMIVIAAYSYISNTPPTKPSAGGTVPAWVDIDNNTGSDSNSLRTAYYVATASNHTSGTWTGASHVTATVVRGQDTSPIGGHAEAVDATSVGANATAAPSITMSKTDGSSVLLHIVGVRQMSAWGASTPSGYTTQAKIDGGGLSPGILVATKDVTTSDGAVSWANGSGSIAGDGATIEILAKPVVTFRSFFKGYGYYQFAPYNVENTNVASELVPSASTGCWVTLIGGGGAGGSGSPSSFGGAGGGGGGRVVRSFIPKASLGSTYTVTQGTGGATPSASGSASTFVSGSVSLSAGGGTGGQTNVHATAGGAGGTSSVSGITATSFSGSQGGTSGDANNPGGAGTNNGVNAGAGGGGGNWNNKAGGKGGDSVFATGGAAGPANGGSPPGSPSSAGAGNGGAGGGGAGSGGANSNGGAGGLYGAGGGGGSTANGTGGLGGAGYSLVEWIDTNPIYCDNVGAGNAALTSSLSWSHTVGASGHAVVAVVQILSASSSASCTATLAGASMSQLGVNQNYATNGGYYASLYMFGAFAASSGAQTVAITITGGNAYSSGNSMSYANVGSAGTASTTTGSGTTASQTVSSAAGQLIVQAFGNINFGVNNFTNYNQIQRDNDTYTANVNLALVMGDAVGATSVSFNATQVSASYGGLAVPLLPP